MADIIINNNETASGTAPAAETAPAFETVPGSDAPVQDLPAGPESQTDAQTVESAPS
ncbi:MAG: hypothetical protein MUC28_03310 [Planctomycetes bacterium]|nr:hypothetical protein [Planctomycetota bacterium]